MKHYTWVVPRDVWDYFNLLSAQHANGLISDIEIIDKMRMYGFPADATPGDHIHIRISKPTVVTVNGRKGTLPGLPQPPN